VEAKRFVVRMHKDPSTVIPPETHKQHLDRLAALHHEGLVEHYGPVAGNAGGILVLSVADRDAAERLVQADPLVVGGYERGEIWEWTMRA
jgi:uncharacterized protein YciI